MIGFAVANTVGGDGAATCCYNMSNNTTSITIDFMVRGFLTENPKTQ